MKRTKTFMRNSLCAGVVVASFLVLALLANATTTFAQQQATFVGDYDRAFAAPNGYYVEPQNNDPTIPSNPTRSSSLFTGDLNPDGSILAGGRILRGDAGDFWLRKFTASGAVDASFGSGGITRLVGPNVPGGQDPNSYGSVRFNKVLVQPDGRIVAAGYDGTVESYFTGTVFLVTRWTANGVLETKRRLDNNASQAAREAATGLLFSTDGSKVFVSGYYQNDQTLVRLNTSDLSLDSTFGTNGIRRHSYQNGDFNGLIVKAIQPDGKILAVDRGVSSSGVVRLNADGSPDQSFGNVSFAYSDNQFPKGRLALSIQTYERNNPFGAAHILFRPDGKINLIGSVGTGFEISRGVVSQQTPSSPSCNLAPPLTLHKRTQAPRPSPSRAPATRRPPSQLTLRHRTERPRKAATTSRQPARSTSPPEKRPGPSLCY